MGTENVKCTPTLAAVKPIQAFDFVEVLPTGPLAILDLHTVLRPFRASPQALQQSFVLQQRQRKLFDTQRTPIAALNKRIPGSTRRGFRRSTTSTSWSNFCRSQRHILRRYCGLGDRVSGHGDGRHKTPWAEHQQRHTMVSKPVNCPSRDVVQRLFGEACRAPIVDVHLAYLAVLRSRDKGEKTT